MENNSGYRRILTLAPVYRFAQRAIGAENGTSVFVNEYARCQPTDRVVDIGCGTADVRDHLDVAEYVGIDPNPSYVAAATQRLDGADRALQASIGDDDLMDRLPASADVVLMVGVLHHLDDALASAALDLAADLVGADGRCVTIDPLLRPGQQWLSRALVTRDRGGNVRPSGEIRELFESRFSKIDIHERDDLLRLPYDHVIVEASA